MAGRRFEVADVAAVLQHWQAGRSRRQLARSFGMGRNRIDRIVGVAEAAGLAYLGLEGVAERGFVIHARERWGPPVGRANRLVWALPWSMLEQALALK